MIPRGDVAWVDFGAAFGGPPAKRRPVVVVQADAYNLSQLATVVVAPLTTNLRLATMPGNVFVPAAASGLPKDSVANVTALTLLGKEDLSEVVGRFDVNLLADLGYGLRRVLGL